MVDHVGGGSHVINVPEINENSRSYMGKFANIILRKKVILGMNLKNRLNKIEKAASVSKIKEIVVFISEPLGSCKIPGLNFTGSIQEGKSLLSEITSPKKLIIFNIPRPGMRRS